MSTTSVRAALETALAAMTPALLTAWENGAFASPAQGVPYQRVNCLFANPENAEIGRSYREQGIFQITLCYPLQKGPADAAARAELIRATFHRGASFTAADATVTVVGTPSVSPGTVDADRWSVPVKVRFISNVFTN